MFKRFVWRRAQKQTRPDPFTLLGLNNYQPITTHQRSMDIDREDSVADTTVFKHTVTGRTVHHLRYLAVALGVGALLIVAGLYLTSNGGLSLAKYEFAYFEIKALDAGGHPVAGALVRHGDRRIGVTDSFGEWRRYMKVQLGRPITITISKQTPVTTLEATRNFAIPYRSPKDGDIEITGRIQLHDTHYLQVHAQTQSTDPAIGQGIGESPIAARAPSYSRKTIHFSYDATNDRHMSQDDRTRARYLRASVIPSLVTQAKSHGYEIDPHSTWQVVLTHLPLAGESGFIMVTSRQTDDAPSSSTSFIRNYLSDVLLTAERLFTTLESMPPNGWIDRSPSPQWSEQRLRVMGEVTNDTHIFISGFPAHRFDNGQWRYWGQNNHRANLTVVKRGRIVQRTQIMNSKSDAPLITVPQLRMAMP